MEAMATSDRCPKCGAMVLPEENFCPRCGAPLNEAPTAESVEEPLYGEGMGPEGMDYSEVVSSGREPASDWEPASGWEPDSGREPDSGWEPGQVPATIEQLRAFCDYHGMPLRQMRFFVGEDFREARAFGIYRDGDEFIVYKNKSDGRRAVRYHGPDEAYAVGELYAKLLDECHSRDLWPDGKPQGAARRQKGSKAVLIVVILAVMAIAVAIVGFAVASDHRRHAHDGYYNLGDEGIYYRYGSDWYYEDDDYDWVLMYEDDAYDEAYADYYLGDDYDSDWGYSNFRSSDTWESIQEESRSSSDTSDDYSDWDSGGTDWDSDW